MGTGISAAIPLIFKPYEGRSIDVKYFSKSFFDCYDVEETDGKKVFTIKTDLLFNNYKPFLEEFYTLIEEDFHYETKLHINDIPDINSLEDFTEFFDGDNRNNRVPFMYGASFFSVLGGECEEYWKFYSGSYKAILEVYKTLLHFEKILAKAMTNPLANAVKFGIFG
jgi:hypothetical protein